MVHELIKSYGLLDKMKLISSTPLTEEQIKLFHSEDYIQYLKTSNLGSGENHSLEEEDEFGLGKTSSLLQFLDD